MHAKLLQLCLTLFDPMDCNSLGFSVHGVSPGKNIRVGCCDLLQGIFLTLGWNLEVLTSLALAGGIITTSSTWEAPDNNNDGHSVMSDSL